MAVYCKEWNPAGSWYAHGASATAIFEMTGGLVYSYRGNWTAAGRATTWECDWRINGAHGSLTWDGGQNMRAETAEWKGAFFSETHEVEIPPYKGAKVGGHGGVIRDFVECVRSGRTPETVCTDNIKSLAMVFGAIESAEGGARVEIGI